MQNSSCAGTAGLTEAERGRDTAKGAVVLDALRSPTAAPLTSGDCPGEGASLGEGRQPYCALM